MPTHATTIRMDPDLREQLLTWGRETGLGNFTEIAEAAFRKAVHGDSTPELAAATARIRDLEAELGRTRAQVARLTAAAGRQAAIQQGQDPVTAVREAEFTRILTEATPADPARPSVIRARSGLDTRAVFRRLAALTDAGYLVRVAEGRYVLAEGADIEEGMRAIRGRLQAPSRRTRAAAHGGSAPEPSAARTEPPEARSAAVARVRERAAAAGAPIVAASELPAARIQAPPPGTAKFQAPGAAPVVMQAVPEEIPDPGRKKARTAQARCVHRVPAGSWCKQCGRTI